MSTQQFLGSNNIVILNMNEASGDCTFQSGNIYNNSGHYIASNNLIIECSNKIYMRIDTISNNINSYTEVAQFSSNLINFNGVIQSVYLSNSTNIQTSYL